MKIATGKKARSPNLDTFAAAFAVAGENQEMVADQKTVVLLRRFPTKRDVQKARAEFERAQKVEEWFHKDFDSVDFTGNQLPTCDLSRPVAAQRSGNLPGGWPENPGSRPGCTTPTG
jgi:hypothetical protein